MADDTGVVEPPDWSDDDSNDERPSTGLEGQDGASVPGVPFAYDLTRDEILRQEASIREVNSRLGFLLAATLTFSTFKFEDPDPRLHLIVSVALIVVLIVLLLGYVPRAYLRAPNPVAIVEDAGNRPGRMKENALSNMLDAFELNSEVIVIKNRYFTVALLLGGTFVIASLLVKAYDGGRTLWEDAHHASLVTAKAHPTRRPTPREPSKTP